MSQPLRHEIEKLATKAFAVAHERISVEGAERKRQALIEVARRGNVGGYVPALTKFATERVREAILAFADSYVDAFRLAQTPADAKVEIELERSSLQIAGGAVAGVRGELDLISKRTQRPLSRGGGHIEGEIEKSRVSALNEAHLKLARHRMGVKIAAREAGWTGGHDVTTGLTHPSHPSAVPSLRPRPQDPPDHPLTTVQRQDFIAPFLVKQTLSGIAKRYGIEPLVRFIVGTAAKRA